jgi:hypothetical protein
MQCIMDSHAFNFIDVCRYLPIRSISSLYCTCILFTHKMAQLLSKTSMTDGGYLSNMYQQERYTIYDDLNRVTDYEFVYTHMGNNYTMHWISYGSISVSFSIGHMRMYIYIDNNDVKTRHMLIIEEGVEYANIYKWPVKIKPARLINMYYIGNLKVDGTVSIPLAHSIAMDQDRKYVFDDQRVADYIMNERYHP